MQLIGSTTSPYVRRIRLYLADTPYQFKNLDIFAEQDRAFLTENNPALKVPALIDDEKCIYDSRVIFRYLADKFQAQPLTWQQENTLTLIDSINDSLVSMLILKRSGFDTEQDALFFNLQKERCETVFKVLDHSASQGEFEQWGYPAICLYCLLDWAAFRELFPWQVNPSLLSFYHAHQNRSDVVATDPR